VHAVVSKLRLSRQTLFRRRKAEDVSFERVLDDLRHRLRRIISIKGDVNESNCVFRRIF
jgi:hypothetical protein